MIEHISYERVQLGQAMEAVTQLSPDDWTAWHISEAGLIHARNLIEFLFLPSHEPRAGQSPTARAVWYTKGWSPYARRSEFEQQLGARVDDVKRSIDRRVCHLALDRDEVSAVDLATVGEAVIIMWRSMQAKLAPEWKNRFPR